MNKAISIVLLCMIVLSVFCAAAIISPAAADENYIDNSKEYSPGDGAPPEDGMTREEPRTRFKDA
jgi:hypothetical protein